MKSLKYIAIVVLFFAQDAYGQVGCRIGDYILTAPTGGYTVFVVPLYSASNRIAKRNWSEDPQCGIDRNVANAYPTAPGNFGNPSSRCAPSYNTVDWGYLVYYKQSDNTCNVNLPLDDDIWFLLPLAASLGAYFLCKQRFA